MHQIITAVALVVGFVAAVVTALHRRYTTAYERAGANAPLRARTLAELGLRDSAIRRRLTAKGVLRESGEGYYLDESVLDAFRRRGRLIGLTVVGITLVVLSVTFLVT